MALALEAGKDVTLRAACRSGKAIAMILPALLDPKKFNISVSPLNLIEA